MQLLLDVPLAGFVVGQSDDASKEPVAGRVLREVKLGCCCGRSYLVRCSGNKNSWTLWVKHRPDALVLDLLWNSCPFFLTGRLHEAVRPVRTSVWKEQEVTPVMPSFCVNLRRGMLRRYRQVPRTEADGAFNYSRASNRPGLLKSGRLHTKPSLFQLHF